MPHATEVFSSHENVFVKFKPGSLNVVEAQNVNEPT